MFDWGRGESLRGSKPTSHHFLEASFQSERSEDMEVINMAESGTWRNHLWKNVFQSGKFRFLAAWSDINLEYDLRGKSEEVTTSLVKDIGPVWKRVFRDKKTRPARKV